MYKTLAVNQMEVSLIEGMENMLLSINIFHFSFILLVIAIFWSILVMKGVGSTLARESPVMDGISSTYTNIFLLIHGNPP